jgi:cytosine/adenosine deaminase-related metal-dependent hydrolase
MHTMTDSEKKLLIALVAMVHQHLDEYGDEVDNLAESAGERAIQVLADFGLMEL